VGDNTSLDRISLGRISLDRISLDRISLGRISLGRAPDEGASTPSAPLPSALGAAGCVPSLQANDTSAASARRTTARSRRPGLASTRRRSRDVMRLTNFEIESRALRFTSYLSAGRDDPLLSVSARTG